MVTSMNYTCQECKGDGLTDCARSQLKVQSERCEDAPGSEDQLVIRKGLN